MLRMNIANYLIGELSSKNNFVHNENRSYDIIDNLIEGWERKNYTLPNMPKDDTVYTENIHLV